MKREKLTRDGYPTACLDAREAAAYLAVSRNTLYRMVRAGMIPHTRVGGDNLRFRLEDLAAYLKANTSRTWRRVGRRGRPANPSQT